MGANARDIMFLLIHSLRVDKDALCTAYKAFYLVANDAAIFLCAIAQHTTHVA